MFKLFFLILAFSSLIDAQRLASGQCPTIATDNEFDVQKFLGKWYVTEYTPSIFDFILRCVELDYESQKDGQLTINMKGESFAGLPILVKGDGVTHDSLRNGHYNVRYSFGVPFQGTVLSIVDTDYKEYAVVYSCTNSLLPSLLHGEHVWVLTKTRELTNPSRQNIYTKLDKLNINRNGITLIDSKICPKILENNKRDEEILNLRPNFTNIGNIGFIRNNLLNNANIAKEDEILTDNPIKV